MKTETKTVVEYCESCGQDKAQKKTITVSITDPKVLKVHRDQRATQGSSDIVEYDIILTDPFDEDQRIQIHLTEGYRVEGRKFKHEKRESWAYGFDLFKKLLDEKAWEDINLRR